MVNAMQQSNSKQDQIAEYRGFLENLSQSTENYLYLFDLKDHKVWLYGNVKNVIPLGAPQADGSYDINRWVECLHVKDRAYLLTDIELLYAGKRTEHDLNYRIRTCSNDYLWVNGRGNVQMDENGKPNFMIGRISQTALRYKVDALTGLFNSEQMTEDMSQCIANGQQGYFVLIGIDNLGNINTRHGRMVGDRALQTMASALEEIAVSPRTYRLGGDMFAVPVYDTTKEQLEQFVAALQKKVSDHFTISCGAVPLDLPDVDVGKLLQYSEFALNKTKKAGKNGLTVFEQSDYQKEEASASLLGELMDSVRNGCTGFSLVYQPQVRTGGYRLFGAEALLRYASPTRGRVFPDEFIPILESSDLMYEVGLWVLKTALEQCKEWRERNPEFHISVNISYAQLCKPGIKDDVLQVLQESGLPGDALTLEVTESMQLQNYQYYNEIFSAWKAVGIYISVDDFGTGYSSLGYLKNLNIDEIKIDRCFVSGIQSSSYNYLLLSNMVELATDSRIRVCCEGVEETCELQVLEDLKPDLLQGYLFSKPREKESFERLSFEEGDPEYQEYMQRVGDIKASHISDLLNLQHRNILRAVDMGLWVIRVTEDNEFEMYTDDTMKRILGVERSITPAECYHFWAERVREDCRAYVSAQVATAFKTGKVVQADYFWQHPTMGEVEIVCTGVRCEAVEGETCLQGYHRVISSVERMTLEEYENQK